MSSPIRGSGPRQPLGVQPLELTHATDESQRRSATALSITQERHLYFEALTASQRGAAPPFNFVECRRLVGPLDPDVLRIALNAVVARHAVFRAAVMPAEGVTDAARRAALELFSRRRVVTRHIHTQRILDRCEVTVRVKDTRTLAPDRQRAVLRDGSLHHAMSSFDYARPPQEHALILSAPHLAADAWSMQLCWDELFRIYHMVQCGRDTIGPESPPFSDFVAWQEREYMMGRFAPSIDYWREQWRCIADFGHLSPEAFDFARPGGAYTALGTGVEHVAMETAASERIRRVAGTFRVTPAAVFLAAFVIWVHRHTGRWQVVAWIPFANRQEPRFASTVGWLANGHPLSIPLDKDATGVRLIQSCQRRLLRALQHEHVPAQFVWHHLAGTMEWPARITFNYFKVPATESRYGALTAMPDYGTTVTPGAGLGLRVLNLGSGFMMFMAFAMGRFRADAVRGALEEYRRIAVALVTDPVARIDSVRQEQR